MCRHAGGLRMAWPPPPSAQPLWRRFMRGGWASMHCHTEVSSMKPGLSPRCTALCTTRRCRHLGDRWPGVDGLVGHTARPEHRQGWHTLLGPHDRSNTTGIRLRVAKRFVGHRAKLTSKRSSLCASHAARVAGSRQSQDKHVMSHKHSVCCKRMHARALSGRHRRGCPSNTGWLL